MDLDFYDILTKYKKPELTKFYIFLYILPSTSEFCYNKCISNLKNNSYLDSNENKCVTNCVEKSYMIYNISLNKLNEYQNSN